MSVDNNAILFVGQIFEDKHRKVLTEVYENVTKEDVENIESLSDFLWSFKIDLNGHQFGYDGEELIGFKIGDSGSYDSVDFDPEKLIDEISWAAGTFYDIFEEYPRVYLFNYQF